MENKEQIGKIWLDLSKYPGEDFYCDGAVEDEILKIARDYSPVEYPKLIEEKKSWPVFYHLSSQRENIVEFLPITKEDKVLEVGSGCGAITGALAKKAGNVTCVDLSKKRSMINAYRHGECDNVTIHVGNFKDIEPDLPADYDYICLIGVFEYGQSYIGGDKPFVEFLNILKKHLKKDGRIVIAIENKYGLKYFAGCAEDHLGSYFSGVENYAAGGGVRTFSKNGLEKIFKECGIEEYHFYYPYPDYKFMTMAYSDKRQPKVGELSNNLRNFDRERMLLFNEKNAFDGMSEDGLFSVFSNSYVAILGRELPLQYVRYSNDRAEEYQIKTVILEKDEHQKEVRKYPLTEAAREHVRNMLTAYEGLKKRYAGSKLTINKCRLLETTQECYAAFEFVEGRMLSELMDDCLERQDIEGFHKLFDEYVERIGYGEDANVTDFDLVFSNIIVNGDEWTLIDYEWTFGKNIETKELAFRALYCYLMEDERRNGLQPDRALDKLGITQQDAENYRQQEREFQRFVTGKRMSISEIYQLIGRGVYTPQNWIDGYRTNREIRRIQIYEDTGNGFREETSHLLYGNYEDENTMELEYVVSGNVKVLRLDPAFDSCVCRILEININGQSLMLTKKGLLQTNGKILKSKTENETGVSVVFATRDPNISIDMNELLPDKENLLRVRMEVVRLPLQIAKDMAGAVKKLI